MADKTAIASELSAVRIDEESSFLRFVYPFKVLLAPAEPIAVRFTHLDGLEDEGSKLWERDDPPVQELMPHVRDYLNPPPSDSREPTAGFWRLSNKGKSVFGIAQKSVRWTLSSRNDLIPFVFDDVRLVVFATGVGFLILDVGLKLGEASALGTEDAVATNEERICKWLDFVHRFRFLDGRDSVEISATREEWNEKTRVKTKVPFFPGTFKPATIAKDGTWKGIGLVQSVLGFGETTCWWSDAFLPGCMLPYWTLYARSGAEPVSEVNKTLILYRIRNFFHSKQPLLPADEDMNPCHTSLLPYVRDGWFVHSLNGAAFVAFDLSDLEFFKNQMPNHLKKHYFLAYLLALHQRFALTALSEEVVAKWRPDAGLKQNMAGFQRIRNALLSFTARGYFAQAMHTDHHQRYYRKWQEIFQVERLFQEVRDEVQDMFDYLKLELDTRDEEREKKLEKTLSWIGLLIGVPALVLSFLGVNIRGLTSEDGLSLWAAFVSLLGAFVIGGALLGLLIWSRRLRDENDSIGNRPR